jgi:hypothetical protein
MKWIGQLWRGEYSLGKAFWVFGILISVLWYFVTKFLSMALLVLMLLIGFGGPSADGLLAGSLSILFAMAVLTLAYEVLAGVGIWRSAGKFPGKSAYAVFARGAVALYFALIVGGVAVALQTWFNTHKGFGHLNSRRPTFP